MRKTWFIDLDGTLLKHKTDIELDNVIKKDPRNSYKSEELLGIVTEVHINYASGSVKFICVKLEKGINSTKLPWTAKENIVQVPPSEIERLEGSIFLRR